MKVDNSSLKIIADGLARQVFDNKIFLTVDQVDAFIKGDKLISLLIETQQIDNIGLKLLRKLFEENNPFAYATTKTAQVTAEDYRPWLHGKRLSKIEWKNHERLHEFLEKYRGFNPNILLEIAKESHDILNLCGDPQAAGEWMRKGLVFGYVQSGKTTSYSDVIARGIDVGYKVFIVLAGTTNSLRRQTQERMEENVIGPIGPRPGTYANIVRQLAALHSMTRDLDFNRTRDQVLNFNHAIGTIFIIKKNVSVLRSLLSEINRIRGESKIDLPMLLIDDEADNATINTASQKGQKNNITAINRGIREILNCFTKRVYLGYTATPFANIFIDHKSDEDMRIVAETGKDLFPSDFIKSISAPNFYVGANRLFHPEDEMPDNSLQHTIGIIKRENYDPTLPLKHTKEIANTLNALPSSLTTALKYFFLFCAIEKARDRWNRHHTMMINVSRFNAVQEKVELEVVNYCKTLRNSIQMSAGNRALEDDTFKSLRRLYFEGCPSSQFAYEHCSSQEVTYANCEETENFDFDQDIIPALFEICSEITVQTVNMQKGGLDYPANENKHVIAIGGLALSRGLTLEGLSITYILRNASASDTLMQMGRWFGYRFGYENLTRIFMPQSSYDHYSSIHLATEELRQDLELMDYVNKTPLDFGLKVRNSDTGIMITARNKLQTAETITVSKDFSLTHKQAYVLTNNEKIKQNNERFLYNFVEELFAQNNPKVCDLGYTFTADAEAIENLVYALNFKGDPNFGAKTENNKAERNQDISFIEQFIRKRKHESLKSWRVCIPKGNKKAHKVNKSEEYPIYRRLRKAGEPLDPDRFKVTKKDAVGFGDDLKIGLSVSELSNLSGIGTKSAQIASLVSKPTLFIHFLEIEVVDNTGQYDTHRFQGNYGSISILFNQSNLAADMHTYTANQVLIDELSNETDDDDDYEELDNEL
ncbi:Z1 domain-containing protein [Rhodobacteraceae bacterium]|nr:Z1 domain-containing protein [Paracoccaceae bacterium]